MTDVTVNHVNSNLEASDKVRKARERAELAEAELARVTEEEAAERVERPSKTPVSEGAVTDGGEVELRKDSMMAYLLDALQQGRDIGHYGRLVFAITARHFLSHEDLLTWLSRDPDINESKAKALIRQVEEHGYNPPKRERILEWQAEQEFPILPNPEDPDCGNVYRSLKFPDAIYEHIEEYQEQKESSG
ncbi:MULTISPECIES: hypothetical protein [Acidobacteriaceae]|uniref:hypothetical protein n=1 Tax=Acidobacteriaceae TaxID=204434 RepID=UPI001C202E26|nr:MULTISPECIES: hypothetical protein [Acidobacteriaceae]MDW5266837.1 hypothetical protein [Edaphobacter sp.]